MLVTNISNLKRVVDLLVAGGDEMEFANPDGTILYRIYPRLYRPPYVPEEETSVTVQYSHKTPDKVTRILTGQSLCPAINLDDEDDEDDVLWNNSFHWNLRNGAPVAEQNAKYQELADAINRYYKRKICNCGRNFVHPGEDACPLCIISCPEAYESLPKEFCCVCQQNSKAISMMKFSCCGNHIHSACIPHGGLLKCPYCREDRPTLGEM